MSRVTLDSPAPDFTLEDFRGKEITLSELAGTSHVVLVFNRGFS